MMSDYIYQYNWKGVRTEWDYRLEITPFKATPLSSPTTVVLPAGCINVNKLTKKYEKYYYGSLEVPSLEIEVRLSEIDDDTAHAELHESLLNPAQATTVTFGAVENTVIVGPLFRLYIKFNKNCDPSINTYRCIFEGSCRFDTNFSHEAISNIVTLTSIDLNKCILDSFNFAPLWLWYDPDNIVESNYYFELYNSTSAIYHIAPDGSTLKINKYQVTDDKVQIYAQVLYRLFTRNASASYTISTVFPNFNKQLFDGTGGQGASISNDNLFVIGTIGPAGSTEYGDVGLFSSDDVSLMSRYPDSVWDYFSELAEFAIAKVVSIPGGLYMVPIFGSIGTTNNVTLSKNILNKIEIKPFDSINKTTSSLYESFSDAPYADIDHLDIKTTGSRNSGAETYPVLYNNAPSAVKYLQTDNIGGRAWWNAHFPKSLNLLYFDTLPGGASPVPIRVHEYCSWDLGDGLSSSDLPDCGFRTFNYASKDPNDPSTNLESMQKEPGDQSCLAYWLANTYNALFKSPDMKALDISVYFDEVTSFSPGGDVGFVWWDETVTFRLNLQTIHSRYKVTDKFYMIKSELNFEKEEASLELLSRSV
jgi:hypothetical protein